MPSPVLHQLLVILLWGGVVAYVALMAMLVVNVITENRNPLSTLGWVHGYFFNQSI